jgi:plastocyanin
MTAIAGMRGRRTAAIGALLAVGATMAACGSEGGGQKPAAPESSALAKRVIDMKDLRYSPRTLMIERGETVSFRNVDTVTHNAKGKDFFSRVIEPGASYRHTYRSAGRIEFVCTFHPGMEGTLTVR